MGRGRKGYGEVEGIGGAGAYHVLSGISFGQHFSCLCRADFEVRDDGHGFDLLGPVEASVVAYITWGDGWSQARVFPAGGLGKHFGQRDFLACHVFRVEFVEIGAYEAAVQCCGHVVWMSLHHEAEVQQARLGKVELADDVAHEHAGDDCGARGAETPS